MAKSNNRNAFQLSALAAALCLSATGSYAAGLGKITVLSPLGQPLRAEIDVNASREELASMNARLASPEAFRQVGIEYVPGIAGIRFVVDKRKDGQPYLRMISDRPINEPFLDVLVELTWSSGRMVREYTVLLDPPESLTQTAPVTVAVPTTAKPVSEPKPVAATPVIAPAPQVLPEPVAADKVADKPIQPAEKPAPLPQAKPVEETNSRLVKSGDTLTKIAAATKPEGISLDQMLVALFQNNRGAFDGNNMNRLRAGKILTIPDADAAAAIAPAEARGIIVAQSRDFNAYRSRLAASVAEAPAKQDVAQQQDQGKVAPKVADKAALPETAKDKLEVSRTEAAKETKALQGRITSLEEDLVARERALKEANSRVVELEKNLADLKKLAELKSQSGAQMQKAAEATKPVAEAKPIAAPPVAAKPAEVKQEAKVEPPKPVVEPPKVAEVPVAPVTPEAPKVETAQPKKPPVQVAAPEVAAAEPGFIDENPLLVYGGGGLVVLLLGYLGFSSWRRKSRTDEAVPTASRLSEGDLMANSVFGTTGGQAVDTSASIQTDFSQASLSAIDTDEGVDPVAEADVYMAYGRDAQAEEILVDALKTDPTRLAIYHKLLEIYAGHKNTSKFEKVASDLHAQTGGSGPDWETAAAMGRSLDPGNPLYAGAGEAEVQVEPLIPEESEPPAPAAPAQKLDSTVTLPGQLSQIAETAAPAKLPDNLGFDLDLGGATASSSGASPLDLDIGVQAKAPDALDVELSLPEIGSPVMVDVPAKAAETSSGLDFEFDLDSPVTATPSPSVKEASIDFSGINLDLVTSSAPSFEAGEPAVEEGDNPDVATKLELAQAYEEMGDREGARELLGEVIQEGSARQQELARTKLAALDV